MYGPFLPKKVILLGISKEFKGKRIPFMKNLLTIHNNMNELIGKIKHKMKIVRGIFLKKKNNSVRT